MSVVPKSTSYTGEVLSASTEVKYRGLLEPSIPKQIRRNLVHLMTYFDDECSQLSGLSTFTTIARILQLYLPATFPAFFNFFTKGELVGLSMNVLSVFCHIVPAYVREKCYDIVLYVYIGLMWVYFITFLICSEYFKRRAKLSLFFCYFLKIFTTVVALIIEPIAVQFLGEVIGTTIATGKNIVFCVVINIVSYLTFEVYNWIVENVTTVSLVFRQDSLMTVQSKPQAAIIVGTIVPTFLIGIGSKIPVYYRDALFFLAALMYISNIRLLFLDATFSKPAHSTFFGAANIAAALNCLYIMIMDLVGNKATLFVFYTFVVVLVVAYLVSYFALLKHRNSNLVNLDEILDETKQVSDIKNIHTFLSMVVTGFINCHPVCLNWSIFQNALEVWPNDPNIFFVFAKFVAIYPEQNKTLEWIQQSIIRNNVKGAVAKNLVIQIVTILRQRQFNLSVELKREIAIMTKTINSTKHKLCNVWDLIIQGNTKEMESAIDRAYLAVQKNSMELNQFVDKYPNNRYVAKIYAHYQLDVLGDKDQFREWQEKCRKLQRGQQVTPDRTHTFGMQAFPSLPITVAPQDTKSGEIGSVSIAQDFLDTDETFGYEFDETQSTVKQYIDAVKIPAVSRTKWQALIVMLFAVIIPPVILTVCLAPFVYSITDPLPVMKSLSDMRTLSFQVTSFALRYLMENTEVPSTPGTNLSKAINLTSFPPPTLGSSAFTRGQLESILSRIPTALEGVAALRAYLPSDPKMDKARDLIFANNINYTVRLGPSETEFNIFLSSANTILQDNGNFIRRMLEKDAGPDRFAEIEMLTAATNMRPCAEAASNAITLIIETLQESADYYWLVMMIIDVAYSVIILIMYIVSAASMINSTRRMKEEIYKCLTSLPKSTVSVIAESLRTLKKKSSDAMSTTNSSTDQEVSRQEETMMKTFASAGDSAGNVGGMRFLQIFTNVITCICGIAILIMCCQMYISTSASLVTVAPHVNFMMGIAGYADSMLFTVMYAGVNLMGVTQMKDPADKIIKLYPDAKKSMQNYYSWLRFGTEDGSVAPYSGFDQTAASIVWRCYTPETIPTTPERMAACYSPALQVLLLEGILDRIVGPYINNPANKYDTIESGLDAAWRIGAIDIYDRFLQPMFEDILSTIQTDLFSTVYMPLGFSIALIVISIIAQVLFSYSMEEDGRRLQFALSMLLQCPATTVTKNAKIMAVLSGNYGDGSQDSATRNTEFYNQVVHNMVDAIVVAATDGTIQSVNVSGGRMFKVEPTELIGTPMIEYFNSERFGPNVSKLFAKEANQEVHLVFGEAFLKAGVTRTQGITILTFRDETQMVYHSRLIDEERAKSDKLLSAILPASLVPRVQAGESNISFSVQSATVLFIDIVEFTPWCGSNTAQHVMMILNAIFKEFDRLVAESSTITRIKCIGDCYMAAGGIFAEINQPAEHAREMVQFGIDAIHVLEEINQRFNQTLRIRVGINSGGPLVAGVIGTEKPTFEIIGPCINMAQQMEHNGVPMQVHISRSTYELIYGANFNVKERGQIDIKGGKATTYLVSP